MIVTPLPVTIVSPGRDPVTLPPSALAPSHTAPAAMALIASSVTSSGGLRPGTWAVVITTSCLAIWPTSSSCWAWRSSAVSSRA